MTIAPITSQPKRPMKTHVKVMAGRVHGTVLCEKLDSASKDYLGYYCGTLPDETMAKIDRALALQLGLGETALPAAQIKEEPADTSIAERMEKIKADLNFCMEVCKKMEALHD